MSECHSVIFRNPFSHPYLARDTGEAYAESRFLLPAAKSGTVFQPQPTRLCTWNAAHHDMGGNSLAACNHD
jgi:hypothetical protein